MWPLAAVPRAGIPASFLHTVLLPEQPRPHPHQELRWGERGALMRLQGCVSHGSGGSIAVLKPWAATCVSPGCLPLLCLPGQSYQCWNTCLSSAATLRLVLINLPNQLGVCCISFNWSTLELFRMLEAQCAICLYRGPVIFSAFVPFQTISNVFFAF